MAGAAADYLYGQGRAVRGASVCVCTCMCMCMCVCVRVCACACVCVCVWWWWWKCVRVYLGGATMQATVVVVEVCESVLGRGNDASDCSRL